MEEAQNRQEELLTLLDKILKEIEANPDTIPEHIFETIEHLCMIYNRWKHNSHIKNNFYSEKDIHQLEGGFQLLVMTGGAEDAEANKEFDIEFSALQKKLDDISTQWRELIHSLGIVSFDSSFLTNIQELQNKNANPMIRKQVRTKIYQFLSTTVEVLRMWILMSPLELSEYKFFLSLCQTFLDMLRGQTKQAALSSIGMFDKNGYKLSVVGRFLLNMVQIVTPNLEAEIGADLYQNTKSTFTALLLWSLATFAPERLQTILNDAFEEIQAIIKREKITFPEEILKELDDFEPKAPFKVTPNYDDLLNLQTLLTNPKLLCDPSVEKLLEPIRRVQTLRLLCDMLNLPLGKAEYESVCPRNTTRKQVLKGGRRRKSRRNK